VRYRSLSAAVRLQGRCGEPFFVVDALCALPRRHILARKRVITAEDLKGEPLIADSPGVLQQAVEEMFERAGIVPRFDYTAQYTAPRCGLVAEGLGIAIVDAVPARALTGLPIALRPFQPRISVETVLIRPEGRPPSNLAASLIALLKAERDAIPLAG
jgi:LysR substrate binding domain